MKKTDEQEKLRDYILGTLGDEDRSAIEERIMTDDDYFQTLAIVEEDLVQEYADGNLTPAESASFEKSFLHSADNRQRVRFARALRKYVNETEDASDTRKKSSFFDTLKAFFLSPVPATLAFLTVAGVAGFFIWRSFSVSTDSEILIALNKIYQTDRPTEARITGFDYAPKSEGTRGGNKNENLDLVLAKSRATEAVLKNETAENLHALGRVYLAENNFDEAINQFEKALEKNPKIAGLHNDLGVAFMEKGKLEEESLDLFTRAAEEFEKSIELDKDLTAAYFNRGLIAESLKLPHQAKEAWEHYLKLDPSSEWADEARERLKKLGENQPVSKTKDELMKDFLTAYQKNDTDSAWDIYSTNRETGSGKLIPLQLAFLIVDSKAAGDGEKAGEYLKALEYIGKLDEEKSGDGFWRDIGDFNAKLPNGKILPLKKSLDTMREAGQAQEAGSLNVSLEKYETAKNSLRDLEYVWMEKLCDYWIGSLKFRLNQLEASNVVFESLVRYSQENNYKWLATHSYVRLTYSVGSQNKHSKAIEYANRALKLALQTNDSYNLQRIYTSLAYDYKAVGQYKLSLNLLKKSLDIIDRTNPGPVQMWQAYENLTFTLFEEKLFRTSRLIQKEALQLARDSSEPFSQHLSELYLAMISTELADYSRSAEFLDGSRKIVAGFEDEQAKLKGLALIDLKAAQLERTLGNFDRAIELFKAGSRFYSKSEFKLLNYEANKGELLCYFASNNDDGFREKLPVVLDIFRKYRREILEEQNRNSFFDNEQNVYDIAVDYEFGKAEFARAFDYSEESRSRSLLDLQNSGIQVSDDEKRPEIKFSSSLSEPLSLAQIQAEMPEDTQLLEYAVLPDKVLIWLITKDGLNTAKTEISLPDLREKTANYRELVSTNTESDEQLKLSKELYRLLIAPIKDRLDANKEVFIIPDKILTQLSFATLFSDKYLVEEFKISYSPSANVFLNCFKKAEEIGAEKSEEILLSIGNPAFNQNEYENKLKPLPSAKLEAEEIAKVYKNPTVFVEETADKKLIKESLKTAEVVHFAGHYLVDEHSPLLSSFVLAGNRKDESNLTNYEIIGENLSRPRLIVLSACDTGAEGYYNGEGVMGAARTFLAMKIPLVVASQWSVDSEATKKLMLRFHALRKTEKLSTAEALRQSQLEMLNDEKFKQPYYWAAFMTVGGYAQF